LRLRCGAALTLAALPLLGDVLPGRLTTTSRVCSARSFAGSAEDLLVEVCRPWRAPRRPGGGLLLVLKTCIDRPVSRDLLARVARASPTCRSCSCWLIACRSKARGRAALLPELG
jgi:hypothetical protein